MLPHSAAKATTPITTAPLSAVLQTAAHPAQAMHMLQLLLHRLQSCGRALLPQQQSQPAGPTPSPGHLQQQQEVTAAMCAAAANAASAAASNIELHQHLNRNCLQPHVPAATIKEPAAVAPASRARLSYSPTIAAAAAVGAAVAALLVAI
jgi:hypothetical protein